MLPTKEEWKKALEERHGEKLQKAFSSATVAICGLGSNIAISLARAGIGKLILIDFDRVNITNLHRQQYKTDQIATARKILGDEFIIGATAKTVPWALEAYEGGADYLGVGAIYPTTTKVKTVLTSTETLADICKAVPIPVNAVGGLNKNNIDILAGIPIAGICVVSAIMKAESPKTEANILLNIAKELTKI